jgi:hypothetical protein
MFEVWEVTFDLKNWRRHRKKLPPLLDNPGSWMYPMAALGLLLVVGGIVSETVFEVLVSNTDAAIRSHESDVISAAEAKADVADQKAAAAVERASALDNQTQGLKTEVAQADARAEDEKLARIKLEKQIQPRTVPDEISLGKKLNKFALAMKGRKVKIESQTSDAEGMLFALEIDDLLQNSGIEVDETGMGRMMPVGMVVVGVKVSGRSDDEELIRTLVYGLRSPNNPGVEGDWKPANTEFVILVGSKPIRELPAKFVHP